MPEETEPVRLIVQGQELTVQPRAGGSGVHDCFWPPHPEGYGFTSAGDPRYPVSHEELERTLVSVLAEINPETGYLG